MTISPSPGGLIGAPRRNSTVLDTACRRRVRSRRLAAALGVALAAGAGLIAMIRHLDDAPLHELHGKVRHATVLQSR